MPPLRPGAQPGNGVRCLAQKTGVYELCTRRCNKKPGEIALWASLFEGLTGAPTSEGLPLLPLLVNLRDKLVVVGDAELAVDVAYMRVYG